MKEKETIIRLPEETILFTYCDDCDLLLYTATKIDFVTEGVAGQTANAHSLAFDPVHKCIVFMDEEGDEDGKGIEQ